MLKKILNDILFQTFIGIFLITLILSIGFNNVFITNINNHSELYIDILLSMLSIYYSLIFAIYDSNIRIYGTHYKRGIVRFILLTMFPFILYLNLGNLYLNIGRSLLSLSIYYIVFELAYNKYKGKWTFYVGTQALLDRIINWINDKLNFYYVFPLWFILLKLSMFVFSIYLIVNNK